MNEIEILVKSIGLNAVSLIGKDHLRALNATFNMETTECVIAVTLNKESEVEFLRATDKLADLRILFIEEADIKWNFEEAGVKLHRAKASEQQFSYA